MEKRLLHIVLSCVQKIMLSNFYNIRWLFFLVFFVVPIQAASLQNNLQIENFFYKPNLPIDSITDSDDTTALFRNPAGLSIHPLQGGYFYGNNFVANIQDHTAFINIFGLAFGTQWRFAPNDQKIRRYTIGSGLGSTRFISLGFSFSWLDSTDIRIDNYISLDLGLILRPTRYLSFGLVGSNLTTYLTDIISLRHRWSGGVSFRPLYFLPVAANKYYDSLTLSTEFVWVVGESYKTILPRYIVNMIFVPGCSMYVGFDHTKDLFVGFKFSQNIIQLSIQGDILRSVFETANQDPNPKGNYYNAGLLIGKERFETKVEALRYYLQISLDTVISEKGKNNFLFFNQVYSFFDILRAIERATTDPQIKGIILTGRSFNGGWGQAEELREILLYFKQISGKLLISYMEEMGNKEYYIASVSDNISMPEGGTLTFNGLSANLYYIKDLLDKLGIKADFIQIGKYKTAPDMFKRSSPSTYEEEQVLSLLSDLNQQLEDDILESRHNKIKKDEYHKLLEKGIFSAQLAKDSHLIDSVEYMDDIKQKLKIRSIRDWKISINQYLSTSFYNDKWGPEPTIAIVVIDGDIVSAGGSGNGIFSSSSTSSDTLSKVFDKIKYNKNIVGVIVRINSPGGSALASDILWKEVNLLKEYKKRVLVSFGNVAASGGYYIAAGADEILANRSTVTGSIGIFGGKFALNGLYNLLGIRKATFKTAENAAIFSEKDEFTPKEKILMEEHLQTFYNLFVQRVENSRKHLTKEHVSKNIDGRVYSGRSAYQNQMVDHLGGLMLAKELLIERLKLDRDYVRFEIYPKEQDNLLDFSLNQNLIIPQSIKKILSLWMKSEKAKTDQVYFLMPYDLEIR